MNKKTVKMLTWVAILALVTVSYFVDDSYFIYIWPTAIVGMAWWSILVILELKASQSDIGVICLIIMAVAGSAVFTRLQFDDYQNAQMKRLQELSMECAAIENSNPNLADVSTLCLSIDSSLSDSMDAGTVYG